MTLTDPAHVTSAAALRHAYQHPAATPDGDGLTRDLSDHHRALGLGNLDGFGVNG